LFFFSIRAYRARNGPNARRFAGRRETPKPSSFSKGSLPAIVSLTLIVVMSNATASVDLYDSVVKNDEGAFQRPVRFPHDLQEILESI
jgi:hypothetical protein